MTTNNDTKERELVVSRTLNAPRELVWEAWTNPKHLINWWGPAGFTNTFTEINIRAGGSWVFTMHGPDGTDYQNRIDFKEVVKPERLAYSHGTGNADDPDKFEVVITLEELNGKTLLTMRSVFASAEVLKMLVERAGAVDGANQTIDKLEAELLKMA